MKPALVALVAALALGGCSIGNSGPSSQCKRAVELSDILLYAAAQGMTAHQDLLEAVGAGDKLKGSEALVRIKASNATVDKYGEEYKKTSRECLADA